MRPARWEGIGEWLYYGHQEVPLGVAYYGGLAHYERSSRWKSWDEGDVPDLYGVAFLDKNIGFVVGQKAHIMVTFNGGWDWILYVAPYLNQGPEFEKTTGAWRAPNFYAVQFLDNKTGWVCGEWGTMLKYNGPALEASPRDPEYYFPFQQVLRRQAYFYDSGTR